MKDRKEKRKRGLNKQNCEETKKKKRKKRSE